MNESPLDAVRAERNRQDARWGKQNHPDGTGSSALDAELRDDLREACDRNFKAGVGTWRDILEEEVAEAFAETDPIALRSELVQVAAVAVAWIEALDNRIAPNRARQEGQDQ